MAFDNSQLRINAAINLYKGHVQVSENAENVKNTDSIINDEINRESAAELAKRAKNEPQNDRENMEYGWIYLLGEQDTSKKTKLGLTIKENPLKRFREMATGNTRLYFFLAYRLPVWYMAMIKIEESTWHDFFANPIAEPGPTTRDALHTQTTRRIQADRIRNYFATSESGNFDKVKCSTRLKRWDGGSSEWFSVTPEDAAAVVSEYIGSTKAERFLNYDVNTSSRNKGDYWDKPIAENELIYCYTEKALREEFDGKKHTPPERPIELCNLVPQALQSLRLGELTLEEKEKQENDLTEEREKLFSWLDGLEKNKE